MLPLLAESWDISDDGLTYTFHLKQGVKFSDGTPFTADDVKWTLDRNRAPESTSAQKQLFAAIASVDVVDPADRQGDAEPAAGRFPLQHGLGRCGDRVAEDRRRQRQQPDRHRPLQARRVGQGRPHHAGPQPELLRHRAGARRGRPSSSSATAPPPPTPCWPATSTCSRASRRPSCSTSSRPIPSSR